MVTSNLRFELKKKVCKSYNISQDNQLPEHCKFIQYKVNL